MDDKDLARMRKDILLDLAQDLQKSLARLDEPGKKLESVDAVEDKEEAPSEKGDGKEGVRKGKGEVQKKKGRSRKGRIDAARSTKRLVPDAREIKRLITESMLGELEQEIDRNLDHELSYEEEERRSTLESMRATLEDRKEDMRQKLADSIEGSVKGKKGEDRRAEMEELKREQEFIRMEEELQRRREETKKSRLRAIREDIEARVREEMNSRLKAIIGDPARPNRDPEELMRRVQERISRSVDVKRKRETSTEDAEAISQYRDKLLPLKDILDLDKTGLIGSLIDQYAIAPRKVRKNLKDHVDEEAKAFLEEVGYCITENIVLLREHILDRVKTVDKAEARRKRVQAARAEVRSSGFLKKDLPPPAPDSPLTLDPGTPDEKWKKEAAEVERLDEETARDIGDRDPIDVIPREIGVEAVTDSITLEKEPENAVPVLDEEKAVLELPEGAPEPCDGGEALDDVGICVPVLSGPAKGRKGTAKGGAKGPKKRKGVGGLGVLGQPMDPSSKEIPVIGINQLIRMQKKNQSKLLEEERRQEVEREMDRKTREKLEKGEFHADGMPYVSLDSVSETALDHYSSDYKTELTVYVNPEHMVHRAADISPENPNRVEKILTLFKGRANIFDKRTRLVECYGMAGDDVLELAHQKEYINFVKKYSKQGGGFLGDSTYMTSSSFDIASQAVATSIQCAEEVCKRKSRFGFVLVRPPGHHAKRDKYGGYCIFNNAAITAKYLQKKWGMRRIMIVDWDCHAGNGTMDIFYDDPSVLLVSIHQDPANFYPHDGFAKQTGKGRGSGYTVNVEMPPHSGDEEYKRAFDEVVMPLYREFFPDFVIGCCGFDAHHTDTHTQIDLTSAGYYYMTQRLKNVAKGKFMVLLEGGYNKNNANLAHTVASAILHRANPFIESQESFGWIKQDMPVKTLFESKLKLLKQHHREYHRCFR